MCETEEQIKSYEADVAKVDSMFPGAKFVVAIGLEELDEVVTNAKSIVIKNTYNCYCYDNFKKPTDYFVITGEKMTNKFIISKLIEGGLELDCNHCFLEGFNRYPKNSECQFEICTGS